MHFALSLGTAGSPPVRLISLSLSFSLFLSFFLSLSLSLSLSLYLYSATTVSGASKEREKRVYICGEVPGGRYCQVEMVE